MSLNIEDPERPRRAKGELAHAVVDGPDGTHAVELSPVRAEALRLKLLHEESFWCSRQAGGCGGALVLAAGPIRVPYFRHHSGADCALAGDSARAARSYEHLHYQRALLAWLEAQGLSATTEHHLGPDGRADLHVIVHSRRHTIEVQLSPLGINEWRRRDEGYHRQVDHVTWLHGAGAETAAAAEQADRDHALHIRAGAGAGTAIEIGVVTNLTEVWSPLGECELRAEQFWTPHLEQALADLAAAREESAARAAEEAADEARREASRQAAARRRAADAKRETAARGAVPLASSDENDRYGTLPWWGEIHPELASWAPEQGWAWTDGLTEQGRAAARVVSYIVSRLYTSGPISMLLLPDETVGAEVVAALERAGFLRLYERRGVERWERT
ncbi:competence protein CoiA family protein [Nocardioides koreensis]|uniref:competence protein CoiA family protein n=1 Tax=Nocardioides koreensis TaxID=433651 RepID=UPI0031D6D7DB